MDINERKYRSIGPAESAASGWGVEDDTADSSDLTTDELRQKQQLIRQDQESGLDALSQVVSQQKRIATAIGSEVEAQNDIIDEIAERTDNTQNQLVDETDQISTVTQSSTTWPYWLVIGLLFMVIVIVAVW